MDPLEHVKQSMALDAAFLNRGVPAFIDTFAAKAMEEVNRGDTRAADDAAVVSGEAG